MRLFVFALCLFVGCNAPVDKSQQAAPSGPSRNLAPVVEDDEAIARRKSHETIAPYLRHLHDIEFGAHGETAKMQGPRRWFIEGTAKANNDFGKDMQPHYRVWFDVATDDNGAKTWTLFDAELNGSSVVGLEPEPEMLP